MIGHRDHADDLLSGLLDGELDPAEAAEVRAHLEVCAECRTELDDIRGARRSLRSLPAVEPPAGFLESLVPGSNVVPLRPRRRALVANVGAAAAAAVAAVALLGGPAPASAVAPEPDAAVARHDATVSAVSAGLGLGLVRPSRQVTPTTMPPVEELPSSFPAPGELVGYRLAGAFRMAGGGVHLLYEKGAHRLSVFEEEGDLAADGDVWVWTDPRVVVAQRGDVVITVVGSESPQVVMRALEALPSADTGDGGEPLVRRLARACGDALAGLSPAS